MANYTALIGEVLDIGQADKPVLGQMPVPRLVVEVLDADVLNVPFLVTCEDFRRRWIGSCGGPSQIGVRVILFGIEDKVKRGPD